MVYRYDKVVTLDLKTVLVFGQIDDIDFQILFEIAMKERADRAVLTSYNFV